MVRKSKDLHRNSVIKGLAADGPDPTLEKKLMLFGQFVDSCPAL